MSDTGKEEAMVRMHDGLTKGAICSSFLIKSVPCKKEIWAEQAEYC